MSSWDYEKKERMLTGRPLLSREGKMESSGHAEAARDDYYAGMKYKDIAAKYGVSLDTVKSWKQRHGWDRKNKKSVHTKSKKVCTQNRNEKPVSTARAGRMTSGPTAPIRHVEGRRIRQDRNGPLRKQFENNRKIVLATQSICAICGKPVDKSLKFPHPLSATVDHIIPLSRGGDPSDIRNLQLAHRACNRAKSDKMPDAEGQTKTRDPNRDLPQTHNWRTF